MKLIINGIQCLEDLVNLEAEIDFLISQHPKLPYLYLTFEYLFTWISIFKPPAWIIIEIRNESGELIGLLPITTISGVLAGATLTQAQFIGQGLWGYTDFLIHPSYRETVIRNILPIVKGCVGFDILFLGPFHEHSPNLALFQKVRAAQSVQAITRERARISPYLVPEGSYIEYSRALPKSALNDANRCRRRLSELGKVEISTASEENLSSVLDEFFRLYIAQRKDGGVFAHVPFAMYREWALRAQKKGYFELAVLRLDEKAIAAHYGFRLQGRRYYFSPTYDLAYRRFSPGKVLMSALIENSFQDGEIFDFMTGADSYKYDWTKTGAKVVEIFIPANEDIGRILTAHFRSSS